MTSNNAFAARTCIVRSGSHERIQYGVVFPLPENFKNGSNADTSCDVAGQSSCGSGDLFELSDRSKILCFYYFPYY